MNLTVLLREAAGRCGSDETLWRHFVRQLPEPVRRGLFEDWAWQAHGGQAEPLGEWIVWLLMAGRFPELEDELAGLLIGGGYVGPGGSPDRADACVWAMSALMRPTAEPRVRTL